MLGGRDLSMLGQVAIEEESGRATNGLGFAVVDRGPRELLELATSQQIERFVAPVARGEYREAWAVTEPGAGSDVARIATTAVRDGAEWVLNGEKWFVTSEGDPGFYSSRGFEPATARGFRRPSPRVPEPAFQVVVLEGHEEWMTGPLVYCDPFWVHDCVGLRDPNLAALERGAP